MAVREQLELLVELAQVGRGLVDASELLPGLLGLADDDSLDVLITRLFAVP